MAKKRKSSATEVAPTMDRDWQAKDDAHELMRITELSRNPVRASRAMDMLKGAMEFGRKLARVKKTRSKSRGGRR